MDTTQVRRKPTSDQIFGDNKAPLLEVLDADFSELKAEIDALVEKAKSLDKPVKNDDEQAELGKMILDLRAIWKRADEIRSDEKKPILDAGRDLDGWFKGLLSDVVDKGASLQTKADEFARKKAAEARAKAAREAEEARAKAEAERLKSEAAKSAQGAASADARAEAQEAKAERLEEKAAASASDLTRSRVGGVTASAKGAWVARITDYQAAIAPLGALGNFLKEDAITAGLNSMAKVQKAGAAWPGVTFGQEEKATFRR
jgi:hypothetical protein